MSLILLPLFFVVFYFLLIRPQQKRMKEHADLVASLEPGDDVLTNGGLYGTIRTIDGQIAELEIADGVVVRIQRGSVAELIEWDDGTNDDRYAEE
ncbi:MAG TPA: preprotein translocase subunit YajC [Acidimicrobiales bacterium]|nr:preprotein translocase subunit YajC [Acidimicrobiales bacterium]